MLRNPWIGPSRNLSSCPTRTIASEWQEGAESMAGLPKLDRRGWASVAGMGGFIALLHILGWGSLLILVAPHNYQLGDAGVFGIGLGLTAYTLGMRHAFDADHIA